MSDPETLASVAEWFRYASQDLEMARSTDAPPWIRAYHGQQAAEKAIKGVLIFDGADPPKWHDLAGLAELLVDTSWVDASVDGMNRATRWAITGRYPNDAPDPSDHDATRALDIASRIFVAAHRYVDEHRTESD